MISIKMHGSSDELPSGYLWKKITAINNYPSWVKFCRSIEVGEVKEGTIYHDITTLLWFPMRVEHRIEMIKPEEELVVFLPLSKKAKMWHTFKFSNDGKSEMMDMEVRFDLGNVLLNMSVGRVLEHRWEVLMRKSLPELKEVIRTSV